MSADIGALIPEMQPFATQLVKIAGLAGLQPRVTSTLRSTAEQARLYRRYQQGLQKYPVAPPGTSAHEFGYAMDMVTSSMIPQDLADLGSVWKGWGGIWGGEFNDPIHFEYPGFSAANVNVDSNPELAASQALFQNIAKAADLILGFAPGLGEVELVAELVKFGFPESQVLQFLSSPLTYLSNR